MSTPSLGTHLRGQREQFPTLRQAGVAAERFPKFVSDTLDPHHLDVVLMTFVLSGRGVHQMGAATHAIVSPSVAVTVTGQTHSLLTDESGLEVVNVFLDPDLHPLPALQPPLDEALAALIPLPSTPGVATTDFAQLELEPEDRFEPLLDLLVTETEQPRSVDLMAALRTALLATCAHAVIRRGLMKPTRPSAPSDVRIIAVREWLDQHYREPHTLAELAQLPIWSAPTSRRGSPRWSGCLRASMWRVCGSGTPSGCSGTPTRASLRSPGPADSPTCPTSGGPFDASSGSLLDVSAPKR